MQQSLEKRITALEQASPTKQDTVIIIRYDVPGEIGRELFNLASSEIGPLRQHWTRNPDETVKDFTDRAGKEVRRNPYGVGMLLQTD
jgi:hypothetical protein